MSVFCALCEEPTYDHQLEESGNAFCCHGCKAVFNILASQNKLDQKDNHPLLKQAIGYGLITNPGLIKKVESQGPNQCRWVFEVNEMWCPSCAELIHLVLDQQKGVICSHVDYITDLASLQYDPLIVSKESLKEIIENLGYVVKELRDPSVSLITKKETLRFGVAAFLSLNIMMFAYPLYATYVDVDLDGMQPLLAWISLALTLPILFYSGAPVFKRAKTQLKQGLMGMETLVTLGVSAALILSLYEMYMKTYHIYFDTVGVLITFLLLGKMIESKAKFSTKEALTRLHHALPRKGRKLFKDGSSHFVLLKEIQVGDFLLAYAGERIVLDGEIVEGEGAIDESVLTGEPRPILKKGRDFVLSGTTLQTGHLCYRVAVLEDSSTLFKILTLIESEIGHKTPYVRSADLIVKWFTPLVVSISFFVFMLTWMLNGSSLEGAIRSIAVLLIACPCAIGIAAPLVESRLIHLFASKGALIRNRAILADLPNITHTVFDKTGTLTYGKFTVLEGLQDLSDENLRLLKGLSQKSIHPISKTIFDAISVQPASFDSILEITSRGMQGQINDATYFLGSLQFLEENGLKAPIKSSHTHVYFFTKTRILATLVLGDELREDAKICLDHLKTKKILLSGDHLIPVEKLASALAFDEWHSELSPLDKQNFVGELKRQGKVVAMIGDGVNDAPALAQANVGISLISATDLSIQVSDLLLTSEKLGLLPELITIAKRAERLIFQNLFWAFFYNVIGIALAAFGLLTPLFATFAMATSSVFVLLNARRLSF